MGDAVENRLPNGRCFDENGVLRRETAKADGLSSATLSQDAVEINYHGMKPTNVDALAKDAALVKEMEG